MKTSTFIASALIVILGAGSPAEAATEVGKTVAVNPDALGTPPGAKPRTLVLGSGLVFNERIDTSGAGLVQVLLLDGTSMIVGPGSSITINEFVYDPNSGDGSLAVTLGEGTMRFIGGALSKKKGAEVKTAVGTLAIRGAVADVIAKKTTLKVLGHFIKEISFTGGGQQGHIFQSNTKLEVGYDGPGSIETGKIEKSDIAEVKQQLAGKPGQDGGAKTVVTNKVVENSPVPDVNSNNEPVQYATTEVDQGAVSQSAQELSNEVIETAAQEQVRDDVVDPDVVPDDGCALNCYDIRILTAPEPAFVTSFSPPIIVSDPGSQGLVGGTSDPDADTTAAAVQIDPDTLRVTQNNASIDVPFSTVPGTHSVSFTDFDGNTQIGELFVGLDADFLFYSLFQDGDINSPSYAFGGVATPLSALQGTDQLLSYTILPDPRQGISMPFTLANLVTNAGAASISPFYVMAPDGVVLGDDSNHQLTGASTGLFGSLLINGQGANQNSAAVMVVGGFFTDQSGHIDFATGNRGSLRAVATEGSLINGGGLSTKGDPNGNDIFGPNANNMVFSSDFGTNDAFGYNQFRDAYNFETDLLYSTIHVADLTGSQQQSTLTRSTHTITGYAAGMLESGSLYFNEGITSVPYRSVLNNLIVDFDAGRDTMGAQMLIVDFQDADPTLAAYFLSFGRDPVTGGAHRGAYVDDDRYGATGSNNPNGNFVVTDSSQTITIDNDSPSDNFMYFFGSELAPQTSFFAAGHQPCVCKFLEWGYWGGRRDWFDPSANETRTDFFHLGTWVAGNISNEVDLPTSGTASFAGHAVGSVTRDISGVDHQYIAGGGFDMTWDFAARNGTATISDFDGFTVSGGMTSISPPATLTPNTFIGPLSGGGLDGSLSGSFVNGPLSPAQGVIGSFDLMGTGFSATGIVAGEQ